MNPVNPPNTSHPIAGTPPGAATACQPQHRLAVRIAAVAGVFSIVVCALLLYDYTRRYADDPAEATALVVLKKAMAEQPASESLKEQFRNLELQVRSEYFRQRAFSEVGACLLLAGVVIFLGAMFWANALRPKIPMPPVQATLPDVESQWTPIARWAVAAVAVLLATAAVGLSLSVRSHLPESDEPAASMGGEAIAKPVAVASAAVDHGPAKNGAVVEKAPEVIPPSPKPAPAEASPAKTVAVKEPSLKETPVKEPPAKVASPQEPPAKAPPEKPAVIDKTPPKPSPATEKPAPGDDLAAKMWPQFRGPGGLGISAYNNIPTAWNVPKGEGVRWKTAVPLPGNSSPVVWGKNVFLTGADEKTREVYCFDAESGKLAWKKEAPGTPASTAQPPKVQKDTGFAASTPATDGRHVYAVFANGDVAALDLDGKLAWSRSLGIPENSYGHAASLVVHKNLLFVPMDQGTQKAEKSRLYALDTATGKTAWEARRQVPNSWTTPIVIRHAGRDQLITAADPWAIAYDAEKGTELWRAKCLKQDVGPSPTFADGIVYTANQFPCVSAIRPDGNGDVSETHVLWKGEDGLPDTCSPLATSQYVFLLGGSLTCYDAKKGNMLWDEDMKGEFYSSPSMVGSRLYLFDKEGKSVVVEPGPKGCKRVAEGELGEPCVTSPAFQDGCFYIRTEKNLIRIGK